MTDDDFNEYKQSLIMEKTQVDTELNMETERHWKIILGCRDDFGFYDARLQALRNITKEQVVQFYNTCFLSENRKKVSLQIYSSDVPIPDTWNTPPPEEPYKAAKDPKNYVKITTLRPNQIEEFKTTARYLSTNPYM
uniref:Uncharacterized protein n=1 Tax=Lygus hesperus TaxID=30085 RepID=A0A0A9WUI6_LYGHE